MKVKGKVLEIPCCCTWDDAEDEVIEWCAAHAKARDEAISEALYRFTEPPEES